MDFDFDDQPSVQAAPAGRAGARFKPKTRPVPKKKQVSLSTSQTTTNLSTNENENPLSLDVTLAEKNVDVIAEGVNRSKEQSVLHACTEKRTDDIIEPTEITDNPVTQDSVTFGDSVTSQTEKIQSEEAEECHLDMETLDIVQEEGNTTSAYEQHTGKFQPKPRVMLETVIEEEPESHYSVDDDDNNGHFSNDFNMSYGDHQREEVPRETAIEEEVPEIEAHNTNNTVEEEERSGKESNKMGKSKRPASRKRKSTIVKDPIKSSEEDTEKKKKNKKFKHSICRQKRTLEKELLETPDDEIKYLPIRDMLRLVEYKEWLEKKEAKGAPVVPPPTQESNNVNAAASEDYNNNQYYFHGFGEEDEFAMEDTENQETVIVKPDLPVNYQTYMNKTSRTRWSKQDTELFYEGISEFGSNLSMVQQLFPDRTREQIKLKFKLEERRYPLKLNDALSSRSKHMIHYQNVITKLQQEAAAAREGEEDETEEREEEEEEARGEGGETETTTTKVPENEEPAKTEETERDGVKELDGGDAENGVRSDGGDDEEEDDDDFWNSYKSEL